QDCINISKTDWDNFETSWDFKKHPFISLKEKRLIDVFDKWSKYTNTLFQNLKSYEEELNKIFIKNYRLEHEISPDVDSKDIKVHHSNVQTDIKSFISYIVGCAFGRYSLDEEGLIYAGGSFEHSIYRTFTANEDNILPILKSSYFNDDIVTRLIDFVKIVFGD